MENIEIYEQLVQDLRTENTDLKAQIEALENELAAYQTSESDIHFHIQAIKEAHKDVDQLKAEYKEQIKEIALIKKEYKKKLDDLFKKL
jgi:cell division septum initiation protein DivIVA